MTMPTIATMTTRPTATMTRIWPRSSVSRRLKSLIAVFSVLPCRDWSRRLMSPMSGCLVGELDRLTRRGLKVQGAHQVADDRGGRVVFVRDGHLDQASNRDAGIGVRFHAV